MRLKAVSGIMLSLLLVGMLILTFNIQPVKASGTIYIRADGSIDPPTANITTIDNVTYTFTDNIYDYIFVQRNNTVLDGAGYTLEGTGGGTGVNLTRISNVTIKNVEIKTFHWGIQIQWSSNITVFGNNITTNNYEGIRLLSSKDNSLAGNNITANYFCGISLGYSSNNTISGNNIKNNQWNGTSIAFSSNNSISGNKIENNSVGMWLWTASNNVIYHNDFVNNTIQVDSTMSYFPNVLDDGYPSGGNYWSDYNGTDFYSGPYQNETGSDAIGDLPYVIDANNTDRYPLMYPWGASPSVGGISIPVNKLSLLAPYIGLTALSAVAAITVVYVKKRKRKIEIISLTNNQRAS